MDLRNYEVTASPLAVTPTTGDDDAEVEVFCARCGRIIASTSVDDTLGVILPLGPGDLTLADLLTVATQHDPVHRTAPAAADARAHILSI